VDEKDLSLRSAPPDFMSNLVALATFLRLSLRKAAHVAMGECRVVGKLARMPVESSPTPVFQAPLGVISSGRASRANCDLTEPN
jgi:hypothetical protein